MAQLVKINVVAVKVTTVLHQLCNELRDCHVHVNRRTVILIQQRQLMLQHAFIQCFVT
ncbi:Uncharacterised protein [Enterobacter cloacae]|nr:Uncharacterised protein [Enterobacter cloacae]